MNRAWALAFVVALAALPAATGTTTPLDRAADGDDELGERRGVALDLGSIPGHILAAINTGASAYDLAVAMAQDPVNIYDAQFVALPPSGTPTAVSTTPLTTFPNSGNSFAILTTGNANYAAAANTNGHTGASNGGNAVRGTSDRDVVIVKLQLKSAPFHLDNCLSIDYRFLTEEFPEWVGSRYNDAFVAEAGTQTWTTANAPPNYSVLTAPTNFAFDDAGDLLSLNTLGQPGFSAAAASGTTYDGATPHYRAYTPLPLPVALITGEVVYEVYLSIFDQGDRIYDSAVFLDNLDLFFSPACASGPATKVAN